MSPQVTRTKKVLRNAIIGLHDLEFMVADLPESYQKKLMNSNEWNAFVWRIQLESRKKEPDEVVHSLDELYRAFDSVKRHIPEELTYSVARSLMDFSILLEAILNNSQKNKGKRRLSVKLPEGLETRTHIG